MLQVKNSEKCLQLCCGLITLFNRLSQRSYGHFRNRLIKFCLNNAVNLRHLAPHITLCVMHVTLTKWRSYRDHVLCDVTSPYEYIKMTKAVVRGGGSNLKVGAYGERG